MAAVPSFQPTPLLSLPPPDAGARRRQVLVDLEKRAASGILVHVAAWLLICGGAGLYRDHAGLAAAIGTLFGLNALLRLALRPRFEALVQRRYAVANRLFLALLLSNGALWGLLCAVSLHWPPLAPAHELIRLVTFAVCAAGTMVLALVPVIRYAMPVLMMGPLIAALFSRNLIGGAAMALLTFLFLLYVGKASRTVKADYWSAIDAAALLAERAAQLERLIVTDTLTQVHNRLYFDRRIAEEWPRAQREGVPMTLLMLDLDHFKSINDRYGHAVGDRCLQAVAAALRPLLFRPGDVLARYGGEEFAVLLAGTPLDAGALVAERLRLCVQALVIETPQGRASLSCSIGCASVVPAASSDWSTLFAQADAAMYAAKTAGRDRVVLAAAPVRRPAG